MNSLIILFLLQKLQKVQIIIWEFDCIVAAFEKKVEAQEELKVQKPSWFILGLIQVDCALQ